MTRGGAGAVVVVVDAIAVDHDRVNDHDCVSEK